MNPPSHLDETIVAIATPLGEGGLGVIRLSGPQAIATAEKIFKASLPLSSCPTHTLHHGWIYDKKLKVDEAVASIFRAPSSYTGEDVVEISCHGSPVVLRTVVDLCVRHGLRQAKPGEFTQRAFLNGKMDLTQAEAVADLIHVRSQKGRAAATEQLNGGLSRRIEKIRTPLVDLLAHMEANLDFVEEDIPPLAASLAREKINGHVDELALLLETTIMGRIYREGLRVALVGKPNVGKSSLFNALLANDRAIVTDVPGTTRDTLEEKTQWDGISVVLIDTAGLRKGGDVVERLGQERTQSALSQADLVISVVDGSAALDDNDFDFFQHLQGKKAVVAINKSDLPPAWDEKDLSRINYLSYVRVSAKTDSGLSNLRRAVLSQAVGYHPEIEDAVIVTSERHRTLLEEAQVRLRAALAAIDGEKSEESIGWELREAIRSFDRITGADVDVDVLDSVFRQFCVGK